MAGAERRRDARGLKHDAVISLDVDHIVKRGGAASSEIMTMGQGSHRSIAIHIACGIERRERFVLPFRSRGQVGKRWRDAGDHRGARLERVAHAHIGVSSLQSVRLTACRPRRIGVHLHGDSVGAHLKYPPVARGNRSRPRTISFRTFGGGLRGTESGGFGRAAQCGDCQEDRLVRDMRASIAERAGDERNEVLIAQPRVPSPIRIGRCIAHPNLELGLRANLHPQSGIDAQEIRNTQALYFRRPDLVRAAVALQLNRFEASVAQSLHRSLHTCGTHAEEPQKTRVGLERHQRSPWRRTCNKSAA